MNKFAKFIKNKNISHVFGYSGGANLPIINALYNQQDIKFVNNRTEQFAGHSAMAWSRFSNKPGVTVTTSGPGVTNLITPLQDALTDGIPLIAITGQVPTASIGTQAFQECDAIQLTKPCTKWNYQLDHNDDIYDVLTYAYEIAMCNRSGPVHIDIPKDIAMKPRPDNIKSSLYHCILKQSYKSDSNCCSLLNNKKLSLEKHNILRDLIEKSERPVICAGRGCVQHRDLLIKVAKKLDIHVTTTLHGLGSFDEHDHLSLNMLGMHGSSYANYAIQNADLILGLGYRFDDRTVGNLDKYAPDATKVHIDNSQSQLKHVRETMIESDKEHELVSIHADVGMALQSLLEKPIKPVQRSEWFENIDRWRYLYPFSYTKSDNNTPKTQSVIKKLDDYLFNSDKINHENTLFTTGVGNHQMMATQFITWRYPHLMTSGSLGVMGTGLPYAIGAQLAHPDKNTILLDGDGSFNMSYNDLMTVVEHNLPIKIFIFNDRRLQMVHVWQKLFFDEQFIATDNVNPNYVKLARAHGIKAFLCKEEDEVSNIIHKCLTYKGACLVEFNIEPDICLPLVPPGCGLDEMIKLEDDINEREMSHIPPS